MESILYMQQTGEYWEQTYAIIEAGSNQTSDFKAYARIRTDIPSSRMNKGASVVEFPLKAGFLECKTAKLGLSALSKLSKNKDLPPVLFFFYVEVFDADKGDNTYRFACLSEEDRKQWLLILRSKGMPDSLKQEQAMAKRTGKTTNSPGRTPSKSNGNKGGLTSSSNTPSGSSGARGMLQAMEIDEDEGSVISRATNTSANGHGNSKSPITPQSINNTNSSSSNGGGGINKNTLLARGNTGFMSPMGVVSPPSNRPPPRMGSNIKMGQVPREDINSNSSISGISSTGFDEATMEMMGSGGDSKEDDISGMDGAEYRLKLGPISVKFTNLFRFFEVILGFPGLILLDTFGPSNRSSLLYYKPMIYLINVLITYMIPMSVSMLVLEQYKEAWIHRVVVAGTLSFSYLLPSTIHIYMKLYKELRGSDVVDGMFSFKPSHHVRWNSLSNLLQIIGFVVEWLLLICMVLPNNLFQGISHEQISDYWPYTQYKVYFWITIGLIYLSSLLLIMTAVFRGKTLYRFLKSSLPWHIIFLVGNVLFLPLAVILFMSLWCDYNATPIPVFAQIPSMICYGTEHILYARLGFVTMGFFLLQHIFLPAGSFKETITDNLDIIFVPLYLTAHTLFKFLFAGIYVFTYNNNLIRVPILTCIVIIMLIFSNRMGPCSVPSINLLREACFLHASMAGAMSTAYLIYTNEYPLNSNSNEGDRKWLYLYILGGSISFSFILSFIAYCSNKVQIENIVASNMVEIENNITGIGLSSRAMEPLISLSLSMTEDDSYAGRKYINKLIIMILHKSQRVQFQGIWAISSMSLHDEEARIAIHNGGGSKLLLNHYKEFSYIVQLEALAALSNMTLSDTVAENMVRQFNCIPFFMGLINGHKSKHSLFALICVGNLTRRETFREQIRCAGGIQTMVACLMSHDYQKRKFGALALSNMALSVSEDMDQIFRTRGLIERIVKMAQRKEVETQKEIVALVRNLACHSRLRPVLLNSGIMLALNSFRSSVHKGVAKWADEIYNLMQREIAVGSLDEFKGGGGMGSDTKGSNINAKTREENTAVSLSADDKEYMNKMTPLHAKVEWETWGSKLENLFAPLIEITPNIQENMECETSNGDSILINMSICLPTVTYVRFRNDTKYIISCLPKKGYLSYYTTKDPILLNAIVSDTDSIVYTPKGSSCKGWDHFTYIVQLGSITTRPCKLNIKLEANAVLEKSTRGWCGSNSNENNDDDDEEADTKKDKKSGKNKSNWGRFFGCNDNTSSNDYNDDEYVERKDSNRLEGDENDSV